MKQKSRDPEDMAAFSLVEVVIAVGIFAFAILAIVGLLAVSLNSDSGAANDTVLARMTQETVARLRSMPFDSAAGKVEFSDNDPDFYFDVNGILSQANLTNSVYGCAVHCMTSPSQNLRYFALEFRWPLDAPIGNQKIRIVNSSMARYE